MSENRFSVEESVARGEVKVQILFSLYSHNGRMNYRELLRALGRPDRTLYVNLLDLQQKGLVRKQGRGVYAISEKGLEMLNRREAELEGKVEVGLTAKTIEEYFYRKFTRLLLGLTDLKRDVGLATILATFGVYPLLMFAKSKVKPSRDEEVYHRFLASAYVNSVDQKALAESPHPCTVEYFWRVAPPKLIAAKEGKKKQKILGFEFNFSRGYQHALNSIEEAEKVLAKYGRKSEEKIFARLKVITISERRKIIRQFEAARSLKAHAR